MILKRKHLLYGLMICITCFIVYVFFSICGEKFLISIGNQIEKVTGPSAISPMVPLEIIKTITSGIFISTIVAMVFYNQEYIKLHEESIKRIIANSRKLADLYNQIPYLLDPKEDNSLIIDFYKERSKNNVIAKGLEEFDSNTSKSLAKIKKEHGKNAKNRMELEVSALKQEIQKEISHEHEEKYRDSLIKSGIDSEIVDYVIEDHFHKLDEKVEKCRDIYMQILNYDMSEIMSLCNGLDDVKKVKKPDNVSEEVVWDKFESSDKISARMVAKRLVSMYERGKLAIIAPFGVEGLDIDSCTKEELIRPLFEIQKHILYMENRRIVLSDPNSEIEICYSKFNYFIESLHELLGFCAYKEMRIINKMEFAKTNPNYKTFSLKSDQIAILHNLYDKTTFNEES